MTSASSSLRRRPAGEAGRDEDRLVAGRDPDAARARRRPRRSRAGAGRAGHAGIGSAGGSTTIVARVRAARERSSGAPVEREAERVADGRGDVGDALGRRRRAQHDGVVGRLRDDEARAREERDPRHPRIQAGVPQRQYGLPTDVRCAATRDGLGMADVNESPTPGANPSDDAKGGRLLPAVLAAAIAMVVAGVAVGFAAGHYTVRTSTVTEDGRGCRTGTGADRRACTRQRAGRGGRAHVRPVRVRRSATASRGSGGVSPYVPALKTIRKTLTVAALTKIIDHGLGESANPTKPYMPVWGEVISKTQVANLVAYIRAGLPPVADDDAGAGAAGSGAGRRRRGALRPLRLHQLPRPERARRRPEPAVGRTSRSRRSRARTSARSSTPTRRSST